MLVARFIVPPQGRRCFEKRNTGQNLVATSCGAGRPERSRKDRVKKEREGRERRFSACPKAEIAKKRGGGGQKKPEAHLRKGPRRLA